MTQKFCKDKIQDQCETNMKTTGSKKPRFELSNPLNEEENLLQLAWSQTISNNLSSDHGCFVFINSPIERIGMAQYFVINVCSLVLFDQKMMAR